MIGVRTKLFLISLPILVVSFAGAQLYLEREVSDALEDRTQRELLELTAAAARALEAAPPEDEAAARTALMRELSSAPGRSMLIVGGESDPGWGAVSVRESKDTPEVAIALQTGAGSVRRREANSSTDTLYVARSWRVGGGAVGVVRMGQTMFDVDLALHRIRMRMLLALLGALALCAGMISIAGQQLSRTILSVLASTRGAARLGPDHASAPANLHDLARVLQDTFAELARERDRLGAVLEGMSDAVLALDREGRVVLCNEAALRMLRLSEPPLGRTLLECVRQPALHELFVKTQAGQSGDAGVEIVLGDTTRVLTRAARLKPSEGGVVLVLRDVTELRRLESVRRDFVANVSHELRTPVSTILASSETLLSGALQEPDDAVRFVTALHRNAERLSRIITDLLDLSRIEAGEFALNPKPARVRVSAERALEVVSARAASKELRIALDIPLEAQAIADDKALEQVFINLLDNAVKYTPAGGRVRVGLTVREAKVRIEVADDGPGIPSRLRARVFERFYRVDPGRSRDLGGTGLGLSIVKHLVEAMGGSVGVDESEWKGALFWVELRAAET